MTSEVLIGALGQTLDADQSRRQQAEKYLFDNEAHAGFIDALLQISLGGGSQEIRLAASIFVKNAISRRWVPFGVRDTERAQLPLEDKVRLRTGLMDALGKSDPLIRNQLSGCLLYVVREDFPESYPELPFQICESLQSSDISHVWAGLLGFLILARFYEHRSLTYSQVFYDVLETFIPALAGTFRAVMDGVNNKSVEATRMAHVLAKAVTASIRTTIPISFRTEEGIAGIMTFFQVILDAEVSGLTDTVYIFKAKKWCYHALAYFLHKYCAASQADPELAQCIAVFKREWVPKFLGRTVDILMQCVDRKELFDASAESLIIVSLKFLDIAIRLEFSWQLIKEYADPLVNKVLKSLALMTVSEFDAYAEDAYDYVRTSDDGVFGMVDTRSTAVSVIQTMASERWYPCFAYIQECCHFEWTGSDDLELNKRQSERMLYVMGSIAPVFNARCRMEKPLRQSVKIFLDNAIIPLCRCPVGLIRGRAIWALGRFSCLEFEESGNARSMFERMASLVLEALRDTDAVVRFRAGCSLRFFIIHARGRAVVLPVLQDTLGRLLQLLQQVGTDELVETIVVYVDVFGEEVVPSAVEITRILVGTFVRLLEAEAEDMDAALAAQGIMRAIVILAQACKERQDVVAEMETTLSPLIARLLEPDQIDFVEDLFTLVEACIIGGRISPAMWNIFPQVCEAALGWALDQIEVSAPPLALYLADAPNFVSEPRRIALVVQVVEQVIAENQVPEDAHFALTLLAHLIEIHVSLVTPEAVPRLLDIPVKKLFNADGSDEEIVLNHVAASDCVSVFLIRCPLPALTALESVNSTMQVFSRCAHLCSWLPRAVDAKVYATALVTVLNLPALPVVLDQGSAALFAALGQALERYDVLCQQELDDVVSQGRSTGLYSANEPSDGASDDVDEDTGFEGDENSADEREEWIESLGRMPSVARPTHADSFAAPRVAFQALMSTADSPLRRRLLGSSVSQEVRALLGV